MSQESNKKNISMLIKLMKENNIRYVVISPGGTNASFVKAIQEDVFFKCYSIVDERSAMYFAIGLYLQTGEIIATSCTSAQATRNYIPGLTEAFYKRVPILAITMEKHPRFKYQEYMQMPDQTSLPADCVKASYELPYISDDNDIMHSIRVINEALLKISEGEYGPVQLCIPILDWELDPVEPVVKRIKRYTCESLWDDISLTQKKVLFLIGEHRPFTYEEKKLIDDFCEYCDAVVYTNHLSNFHGKYSINGNLSLKTMKLEVMEDEFLPDIIISVGGITGDYPFYNMFSHTRFSRIEHWRISTDGCVVDTYDKLTKVFQCSLKFFCNMVLSHEHSISEHRYYLKWQNLQDEMIYDVDVPFSNVYAAQKLHNIIPDNSCMNFAILNSLRVWSFFELPNTVRCFSNVGAFGIDGGLSTLIGQSVETDDLCFMVIGDLSFYYDMNSLGIRHIKNNLRILLINNGGGVEFKMSGIKNSYNDRFIAAAGHFKNAQGWAETCGFTYISAHSKNEFDPLIGTFISDSDKPILFELFVDDHDDALAVRRLVDANSDYDINQKVKGKAKEILGHFFR